MAGFTQSRTFRMWIAAVYALSMAMLGFAHAAGPAGNPDQATDLSAYTLPDNTVPSVCLTEEDGKTSQAYAAICDACVLTAGPGLLACSATSLPIRRMETLAIVFPPGQAKIFSHSGHVPHLRGPPAA